MNLPNEFLLFNLFVVGGVCVEFVILNPSYFKTGHWRRRYHFSMFRYVFLLLFPSIGLFILMKHIGVSIVGGIFLLSCIAGTILEWCIGCSYHAIVGQRLWTYHRSSLAGYTSLLSIPLWGLGSYILRKHIEIR
ncbi:MAG: Uncharacterized protein Greene041614_762 [Parcubacteria group bacterium Greene0416_14]|nr:MAG: Uncharacterized protein Greene041614_762 [Parcubacteria group bacterium Greene0416_14]